jgi:hypothetical protein
LQLLSAFDGLQLLMTGFVIDTKLALKVVIHDATLVDNLSVTHGAAVKRSCSTLRPTLFGSPSRPELDYPEPLLYFADVAAFS